MVGLVIHSCFQDVLPLWHFAPPLGVSPPGRFATRTFPPCTFRPQDVSPLARVNKVDWLMDWCTFFIFKSLYLYTITRNIAKFGWNIHTNDGTFSVIQNCFNYQLYIHVVWDSNAKKFEMLYSFHDDRAVSRTVRQVLRGSFCKRAEDHLLGLDEVYLHFVWSGPGLQLLKECLHVSLLWTARQEFCECGIIHILMGKTVDSEIIN